MPFRSRGRTSAAPQTFAGAGAQEPAAGARIQVTSGAETQRPEIMIGDNCVSMTPNVRVFGPGKATEVDALRIERSDGLEIVRESVAADQRLAIAHPNLRREACGRS